MRTTNRLLMVFLLFLLMLTGSFNQVFAAVEMETDVYAGIFNKYLSRGYDLSDDKAVAQAGIDVSAAGFTLSLWTNMQLKKSSELGYDAGDVTETDISLEYGFDIGELFSMSLGNYYYIIKDADNTNEVLVSATVNTLLNPTLTLYWDWDAADGKYYYYLFSIDHDLELSEELTINLSAGVGYIHSDGYKSLHNAEFALSADYLLTDRFTLNPTLLYSTPISNKAKDVEGIRDELVAGISLVFSF